MENLPTTDPRARRTARSTLCSGRQRIAGRGLVHPGPPIPFSRPVGYTAGMNADPKPRRRWFHPRLNWLLFPPFIVEGFLLLSVHFGWFGFDKRTGEAAVIALATVIVSMLPISVCIVARLTCIVARFTGRRRFQYSLRSLMLVMLLACIGMSCVSAWMHRVRRQKLAVEAIKELGGQVEYDLTWRPEWFRSVLGKDAVATVVGVTFPDVFASSETDAGLKHLKGLQQLQKLNLDSTQVTDAGLEHLKRLPKLRVLNLCRTLVSDAGLEHLKGLTHLQDLNLRHTRVTDAGLEHLEGLTQLQQLNLWNTNVTDAGLECLKRVKQLHRLVLVDTKVTDEGVKRLQQALPNCQIYQHWP
jgi:hypothetical protein